MTFASEEAARIFEQAKTMLVAKALQQPMNTPEQTKDYVVLSGMSSISYGLFYLTHELREMRDDLEQVKSLVGRARLPGR